VRTLDAIIRDAELLPPLAVEVTGAGPLHAGHGRALCEAAITLAGLGHAEAIVAVTREGRTARVLSALRSSATIVAATGQESVARGLALYRGVQPLVTAIGPDLDTTSRRVAELLLRRGIVGPGGVVVFVNVSADLGHQQANYLKLERLGELLSAGG
jgi:pyruvate kinase